MAAEPDQGYKAPVAAPSQPVSLPPPDVFTELAGHGVVVVEERALRRIVKVHYKLPGIGLQVPHTSCLALTRDALAKVVEGEVDPKLLPDRVVVVAADRAAVVRGDAASLSALWRNIFHARVHEAFDKLALTNAAFQQGRRDEGYAKYQEIVDKYYAASSYRNVKRWLAERK